MCLSPTERKEEEDPGMRREDKRMRERETGRKRGREWINRRGNYILIPTLSLVPIHHYYHFY
jgi:hypothetical protein